MINPLGLNSLSESVGEVIITDIPDQDSCPLPPFNRFCWLRDPASTPVNYAIKVNSPAGANPRGFSAKCVIWVHVWCICV